MKSKIVERYQAALGFSEEETATGKGPRDLRERAFEMAHELRRFEIELLWRRSAYFFGLQAAAYAGVATIASNLGSPRPRAEDEAFWSYLVETLQSQQMLLLLLLLSIFGLVSSLSWSLAAKSSKHWMKNWEAHIDLLEHEFTGNLYKTVFYHSAGRMPSLSGINEAMTIVSALIWCIIFSVLVARICSLVGLFTSGGCYLIGFALSLVVFGGFWWIVGRSGTTNLRKLGVVKGQNLSDFYRRPLPDGSE